MLNELNRSIQGRMATISVTANKIGSFKQKIVSCQVLILRDCHDMLQSLVETIASDSGLYATSFRNVTGEHLKSIDERFEFYFPKEQVSRKGSERRREIGSMS